MSSQIITIDNIEPKVITIDNVATEVITVETIETITIEGVGIQGAKGETGSGTTWGTITGTLSDQIDLKNQQDAQDSAIALNTAKITFPEAPKDGSQYARKDAGWEIVSADVDSVNGQTGVVVLDTDDIDDSTQINKYTTAGDISKLAGIEAGAQVNTVDSVNAKTGAVVINPDDLDDSATVNKFVTASQITVIDNQSGVNTGDQDLSGIATNAANIATINDEAIFSDPASPNEIDFGWLGTRTEYDALVSKPITKMFFVSSFGFLNSVVVSGQTPVNIADSEIYTATVDSNAPDLTYLWTATGTTDATINGSATGSTVTIDYAGNEGDPDSFADIKCVVSSIDVGSSVEDTLQVTVEHEAPAILWTQDFSLLDPVTDVVYGIDPAVTTWIDKGTSLTNLTQTTVANQADLVAGEMVFDADDNYDGVIPVSGDLSYYFEINVTPNAILGRRLIEKAGTTSAFIILTTGNNENLRLKSLEGNNNDFVNYSWTSGLKKMMITKTGTVGKLFVDGVLVDTINTLIGTIGDFDTLGAKATTSLTGNAKAFKGINRALTDAEAIAETTTDWTPADFTGTLASWTDPSDLSTITDTAGAVEQLDGLGGTVNFNQTVSARKPTTGVETIGGLNAILYDGVDDSLKTASNPFGTTIPNATVFIVTKAKGVLAQGYLLSATGNQNNLNNRWSVTAPFSDNYIYFDAGGASVGDGRVEAFDEIAIEEEVLLSFTAQTGLQEIRVNGAVVATSALNKVAIGAINIILGSSLDNNTAIVHHNCAIGETIMVDGIISPADMLNFETYLSTKWGTP